MERIEQACDFLLGQSKDLIVVIEAEMEEAAAALDFERAAELRDMIGNLRQTLKPARQFKRRGVPGKAINPEADVIDLQSYLRLDRPPLVM